MNVVSESKSIARPAAPTSCWKYGATTAKSRRGSSAKRCCRISRADAPFPCHPTTRCPGVPAPSNELEMGVGAPPPKETLPLACDFAVQSLANRVEQGQKTSVSQREVTHVIACERRSGLEFLVASRDSIFIMRVHSG